MAVQNAWWYEMHGIKEFLEAPEATTSSTSSETISISAASDPAAPPLEPVQPAAVLSTMSISGYETRNQREPFDQDDPLATNAPEKFTDPVPPTVPRLEPVALVIQVKAIDGDGIGEDPSIVLEDGLQQVHPSNQHFQNPKKLVYEAPRVVPDEVPGKEEDEEPPDKTKDKKKAAPKPKPYPEDPRFPKIFLCKLCPRKFSFVNSLCTHVEIHHESQFEKIKCDTSKFAAML